jgi:membrane-associated protease RseP (regulator of RpoE activity)
MIRFWFAASRILLLGLLGSPAAFGQGPPTLRPPAVVPAPSTKPTTPAGSLEDQDQQYADMMRQNIHNQIQKRAQDALEANFGMTIARADDTLRAQLVIPPEQGVVVVGIQPGSLAEQAGLKVNDVFLKLGEQEAKSTDQVRQVLLGLGQEALAVKLIREGKPRRLSLVGPEHGFPPEAAEFWIGVPVSPVDATLRSHLPSLAAEAGLIVNDVVSGSPADRAGVQKNDVLVRMDGKPLTTSDVMIAQIQGSKGKSVPLQLLRAGQSLTLEITPAKRSHPTVINVRDLTDPPSLTYQVVRPSMAIQTEPGASTSPREAISRIDADPFILWNAQNSLSSTYAAGLPTLAPQPAPAAATARIEGQLKEVLARLEALTKTVESLKPPAQK